MGLKSRRELLASGVGLGATSALFGPGIAAGAVKSSGRELVDAQRDLRALDSLISGERLLQYCYTTVLESGALKRVSMNVVLLAFGHSQEHASAIDAAITVVERQIVGLELGLPRVRSAPPIGGRSHQPAPFPPAQVVKLFQNLHHEAFCLTQLSRVESYVEGRYFHAVADLGEPELVRTATEILGAKAQQWSLFQNLLSHGKVLHTVPDASVRGSATLPK